MNSNIVEKYVKFKILEIKYLYKKIIKVIFNYEKNLNIMEKNMLLSTKKKNIIIHSIYIYHKKLNSKYNNYLNNLTKIDVIPNFYLEILNILEESNFNFYIEKNFHLLEENNIFKDTYKELIKMINMNGLNSLKLLLELNFNNINDILCNDTKKIINELESIIYIKSFKLDKKKLKNNYLFRIPNKFTANDYLKKERILYIIINGNTYKCSFYFKIDHLSTYVKSSQINYPYLQNKKEKINSIISSKLNEKYFDFYKVFIRHDYLGNIYCMSVKNYVMFIKNKYNNYLEIINDSFINIIKNFISNNESLMYIYNIIFLNLLINDGNNEISIALLNLLKEKKKNFTVIYNFIKHNLTYYLQLKIKKTSNNLIKNELEKLQNFDIDNIDYKKQLILNKNIPDNVKALTLEKIEEMKSMNNDYYKQLTFVKNIIKYPWYNSNMKDFFSDMKNSNKVINFIKDIDKKLHNLTYGHTATKNYLVELMGKWISNPSSGGTSIGLVGPPGVGKTLIAKSISKALDIPFAQITLGGQNDGEILHGHGYTYSGSQPGLIIKKMVEMGKPRCILYFDELDKTATKNGKVNEISSILIHLTDPNMNKSFQDRFFQGVEFPLERVIFIFSYNDSKLIDPILLDRITEIKMKPYTTQDKLVIAKKFIIPEIEKKIGFPNNIITWSDSILNHIIFNYTSEAGVRSIKRLIEKIYLNLNILRLKKEKYFKTKKKFNITKTIVLNILKESYAEDTVIHNAPTIGTINALYATSAGSGGIIPIQIYKNFTGSDSFDLKLTGSIGKVMKESISCSLTCALNYLDRNKEKYKIDNVNKLLKDKFPNGFHIHTPSTSTPKDGPSAGCAFTSAFISILLGKPIDNTISMTGEIELNGKITKIGGLNYKLIGAKKAGVRKIFICKDNEKDLIKIKKEYPKLLNKNFSVIVIEKLDDFIDKILC